MPEERSADWCHSLFGHICRLSNDTPASQALRISIDAFSCPQRTCLQQVEEDICQPISACQFATLDRSLWRSLRPSAS